jgi:hypothetical protein
MLDDLKGGCEMHLPHQRSASRRIRQDLVTTLAQRIVINATRLNSHSPANAAGNMIKETTARTADIGEGFASQPVRP